MSDLQDIKASVRLSSIIGQDLQLKKTKDGAIGLCPFHQEKTPSFNIIDNDGYYYCFGCQESGDVFDWLTKTKGMDFLTAKEFLQNTTPVETPFADKIVIELKKELPTPIFPIPEEADQPPFNAGYAHIHTYKDQQGNSLCYVARYEPKGKRKFFLPAYYGDDNDWHMNAIPGKRPLYGLDTLQREGLVIIVEGEKCADMLRPIIKERPIITWSGGSSTVAKSNWEPLHGRRIVIWPDKDKAGTTALHAIAHQLQQHCEIFTVPLPEDKPEGWDVADALQEGWTRENIILFINGKVPYQKDEPIKKEKKAVEKPKEEKPTPLVIIKKDPQLKPFIPFPDELCNAPGLIGMIANWMNDTAISKQPVLSIASAITAAGTILAHRVQTETGLRSNMYTFGVAPSGSGKDHPIRCIKELFEQSDINKRIIGIPASKQGLIKGMIESDGESLLLINEIGRFLAHVTKRDSSSHLAQVADSWIKLFSDANTTYTGDQKANGDGNSPRQDINQPCLSIYGTTVGDRLSQSMTSTEGVDGFLSRWLLFETNIAYPDIQESTGAKLVIPEPLQKKVEYWKHFPTNHDPLGKLHEATVVIPRVIPLTIDAKELSKKILSERLSTLRLAEKNNDIVSMALYARFHEHIMKLALCGHEDGVISLKVLTWAHKVVSHCITKMHTEINHHVADNIQETYSKKLFRIVKDNPTITKSDLVRKSQWLNKKVREDILSGLIEGGLIKISLEEKEDIKDKKATTRFEAA